MKSTLNFPGMSAGAKARLSREGIKSLTDIRRVNKKDLARFGPVSQKWIKKIQAEMAGRGKQTSTEEKLRINNGDHGTMEVDLTPNRPVLLPGDVKIGFSEAVTKLNNCDPQFLAGIAAGIRMAAANPRYASGVLMALHENKADTVTDLDGMEEIKDSWNTQPA